jgi:hypothetical protein
MVNNKSFYIQFEQNQALMIETHIGNEGSKGKLPLKDVGDLIKAFKTAAAPRLDNIPVDEITLHENKDGGLIENEALSPDVSLFEIHGGQCHDDPLVIKTHTRYKISIGSHSTTRMSLSSRLSKRKSQQEIVVTDFLTSIQKELVPIPNSGGMYVLYNVIFLETERKHPVIVRSSTEPFWENVIEEVDEQDTYGYNINSVCVVGTSGIGKTTTTYFLIRMLLQRHKTVVYNIRSNKCSGYIYEFTPKKDKDMDVQVKVYTDSELEKISSLDKNDTYYIVDPGMTKDNCHPGVQFKCRIIIVASPDERHWGGSSFSKRRTGYGGIFQQMPVWEANEIICAAPYLSFLDPELSALIQYPTRLEEELMSRYRIFGGVPSLIFTKMSDQKLLLYQLSVRKQCSNSGSS